MTLRITATGFTAVEITAQNVVARFVALSPGTWSMKPELEGFAPVSIKMAKQQQLSLNPGKLSGQCGRLKCCLRFELADAPGVDRGGCGDESGPLTRAARFGGCGSGGCGRPSQS